MPLAGIFNITLQTGSNDVKSIVDSDSDGNFTDFSGSVMEARVSDGFDDDALVVLTSVAGEITFPGDGQVDFLFTSVNIALVPESILDGRWQVDHTPSGGLKARFLEGKVRRTKKVPDAG